MLAKMPLALLVLGWSALVIPVASVTAQDKDPAEQVGGSLDDELLEGLQSGLEDPPQTKAEAPEGSDLDEELRRELGEDAGSGPEENPLMRIGRRMRSVEERIAKRNASESTQKLQGKIVEDLEALIKQARQQMNQQQGGSSGKETGSRRSQVRQPGRQQQASRPGGESNQPARDSSARLGRQDSRPVDMAEMNALLKDLWGHLPQRAREQMLQSSVDEFLPKYELMIEQYFRRLADESDEAPQQ